MILSQRRLLAVLVGLLWLTPCGVGLAVALHVELDHGHGPAHGLEHDHGDLLLGVMLAHAHGDSHHHEMDSPHEAPASPSVPIDLSSDSSALHGTGASLDPPARIEIGATRITLPAGQPPPLVLGCVLQL